jgi:hypothetical protein
MRILPTKYNEESRAANDPFLALLQVLFLDWDIVLESLESTMDVVPLSIAGYR